MNACIVVYADRARPGIVYRPIWGLLSRTGVPAGVPSTCVTARRPWRNRGLEASTH